MLYTGIALLVWHNLSPVLEREPCKEVMIKACRESDAWREEMSETNTHNKVVIESSARRSSGITGLNCDIDIKTNDNEIKHSNLS